MAVIESIKQKILTLDPASFQSLCDHILAKEGYPNIVSLGTEPGTRKTTKGTPDTYFYVPDGKYIFVEYTTQQPKLAQKIWDDIKKCLDESYTGIPLDMISEIIYCHTSSNIAPKIDYELRKLCEDSGIKLTIIGIDRLAEDLCLKHRAIAREFLGISMGNGQIQEKNEFVKQYDANRLAAPLNTQFLFREGEITLIDEAFNSEDIVILTGPAGTGKTRLALHYAQIHAEKNEEKLYCIHDNALPIYEELQLYIDKPGKYFLFIDDANQLSGLQHVLNYVTMKALGYEVKVLITVRDYAVPKLKIDISKITSFKEVEIKKFTDDDIKKLITTLLNILNDDYLSRIVRIADGNARIAMLAGRIACESNRLDSINDVSQLYESYFGTFMRDSGLCLNESLIITAGVISFLTAIHLDHIDSLLPVLSNRRISRDTIIENTLKLHEQEIVEICNDKAVRFSEQSLANYLLKYVFFDKKLLSITDMIEACFNSYRQRTIASISTLLGVFINKELYQYVTDEIKKLWLKLSEENSPYFFEFVKAFFHVNETETLLILKEQIDAESEVQISLDDIDTKKGKNYISVNNDIINILGGFFNSENIAAALDLFFQYYLKRLDIFTQFYHASNTYFSIRNESQRYDYYTQVIFFEKLREYANKWQVKKITILFWEVASEFLKLHFSPTEDGRNNTVVIYNIPLIPSEGVTKYRKLIWDSLLELCEQEEYIPKIRELLQSYGGAIDDVSIPIVRDDMLYISKIFEIALPSVQLANCLLAKNIKHTLGRLSIYDSELFKDYLNNKRISIYYLLKGPKYNEELNHTERERIKYQQINDCVSKYDLNQFKELLDICSELHNSDKEGWEIGSGLNIAFKVFAESNDQFVEAVRYYYIIGLPFDLYPVDIINLLFSILPDTEVFALINEYEYEQKNLWLYMYYHELPEAAITKGKIESLYSFLKDSSDSEIKSSPFRDVDFLEKYRFADERVFLNGCRIILSKNSYSLFVSHLYFWPLFNKYHNSPHQVIEKLEMIWSYLKRYTLL